MKIAFDQHTVLTISINKCNRISQSGAVSPLTWEGRDPLTCTLSQHIPEDLLRDSRTVSTLACARPATHSGCKFYRPVHVVKEQGPSPCNKIQSYISLNQYYRCKYCCLNTHYTDFVKKINLYYRDDFKPWFCRFLSGKHFC